MHQKPPVLFTYYFRLVGNIKGNAVTGGDKIAEYIGSGPPKGTGKHRYVFVLFKQPKKLDALSKEPKSPLTFTDNRLRFKIKDFADKHGLGDPVAGTFFEAEWDAYVDERNKQQKNN